MPKQTNQKELIVETALRLFASRGYAHTPISLIASTAKVSQGLLYNFFAGKDELLKEIFTRGFRDILTSMESYRDEPDPREAIRKHITKTVEILQHKREFWRLVHALRFQGKAMEKIHPLTTEIVATVTKIFSSVFKKLKYENSGAEALLFLAQIDGLAMLYLQDEKNIPLKALAQQLIKRYKR